jgi:hypothetical protein
VKTVNSKVSRELKALLGAWPMMLLALLLLVAFGVPAIHQALGEWFAGWFANHQPAAVGSGRIMQAQRDNVLRLSLIGVLLGIKPAVSSYRNRQIGAFAFWVVGIMIIFLLGIYSRLLGR